MVAIVEGSSPIRGIREGLLLAVFAASGAAALIYQVCWQRLLFASFGVDLESITIVVSTFMLGLGCGALVGGNLSRHFAHRLIEMFVLSEVGIGLFGMLSATLIPLVGDRFVTQSLPVVALVNYLLVLIPATLMGATLPILVAHLFQGSRNVGVSIGGLYLANTFGAALGALSTGSLLFTWLTIDQTIYLAASLNFLVALAVVAGLRRSPR